MNPLRALLFVVLLLGLLLPQQAAASFTRSLPALHPPTAQSALIPIPADEWPRAVVCLSLCDLPRPPPYGLFANGNPVSLIDPFGLGAESSEWSAQSQSNYAAYQTAARQAQSNPQMFGNGNIQPVFKNGEFYYEDNTFANHILSVLETAAAVVLPELIPEVIEARVAGTGVRAIESFGAAESLAVNYEGPIYRAVNPAYVDSVLSVGPRNVAANHRYSAPGSGAVYTSTSPEALFGELNHYNVNPDSVRIMTGSIRAENILDLTSASVRGKVGVSLQNLTGNNYSTTQAIGSWARQNYSGILAPSARVNGTSNLILFNP